jgi:hypothetical protein
MADKLKVFLAMAAFIGGILLLGNLNIFNRPNIWWNWVHQSATDRLGHLIVDPNPIRVVAWDNVLQATAGVALLAAGLSYFWSKSRFYRH